MKKNSADLAFFVHLLTGFDQIQQGFICSHEFIVLEKPEGFVLM